jgi:hypothetical protein
VEFFKTISKGIVISFIIHLLFATAVVYLDFAISLANFSVILFLMMVVISLYIGFTSEKLGAITGTIVGIGTSLMLLLYLNQRIEMNWELNRYLIGAYLLTGFVFSLIGTTFKRKGKKPKEIKPEKPLSRREMHQGRLSN